MRKVDSLARNEAKGEIIPSPNVRGKKINVDNIAAKEPKVVVDKRGVWTAERKSKLGTELRSAAKLKEFADGIAVKQAKGETLTPTESIQLGLIENDKAAKNYLTRQYKIQMEELTTPALIDLINQDIANSGETTGLSSGRPAGMRAMQLEQDTRIRENLGQYKGEVPEEKGFGGVSIEEQHGLDTKKRLDEISQELKSLGFNTETEVIKPPFWGSLTKKGKLILEYIKLSNDKDYQNYLQKEQDVRNDQKIESAQGEKEKKKLKNEISQRETRRAMGFRAGGVVSSAEPVPTETKETRAMMELYETRKTEGKLTPAERMAEGEKVEEIIKQIGTELANATKDYDGTMKSLDNNMAAFKKLTGEILALSKDKNYKYLLEQREKI